MVELTVVSTTPPFGFGDAVNFTVTVTDEQPVDCARVSVAYILGHDQHGHPQSSTGGCSGTIQTPPPDAGHLGENIFAVFVASYTDNPRRRGAADGQRRGGAPAAGRLGQVSSSSSHFPTAGGS